LPTPRLSIVVLTLNEAANIEACLASLAQQTASGFEVLVVDAGSTDGTAKLVRHARPGLSFPVRLHVGRSRMPIGEARNLGVAAAKAPLVAFLSADAELGPGWVAEALRTLRSADMAFGPQVHSPHRWTLGAAVRGLRYQFPTGRTADPLRFASNVAAAYRKPLLKEFPFDAAANAAEDLLLASRASAAGYIAAYDPRMVARHHDVATLRQEMRKNLREGRGCGLYAAELGVQWPVLAWLGLIAFAAAGLAALASTGLPAATGLGLALLAAVLWLPAARRALRRRGAMPTRQLWAGLAASPAFDLAFLAQYLRGLLGARRHGRLARSHQEISA
jgi:cellulose synthase/poly-beta-1,6-N-acetylglucosamine synthase-like glycosyltransferase